MALRGWRLIGVAGTVFAYIVGILLLSIVSVQNPQPRRHHGRSISDVSRHLISSFIVINILW